MPSPEHESPLELTRTDPELVAWLLSERFGVDVPQYASAQERPTDVRLLVPHTYHADGVVAFHDDQGRAVLGAVVEMQRSRDVSKLRTWKAYVSALETELDAPAALVVFCSARIAEWYRRRFAAEPGSSLPLRPYWVTPDRIPLITDVATARQQPAATVLSAVLHAHEPGIDQAFPAVFEGMLGQTPQQFLLYYDVVLAALLPSARQRWEAYMSIMPAGYTFKSEYLRNLVADATAEGKAKGMAEGKAEGKAESKASDVLAVLEARGLAVPAQVKATVLATTDLDTLDLWLRRAVTVERADEVIAG